MSDFAYLKHLRVFGLTGDPEEIFQGLGASAAYGGSAPGDEGSDGTTGTGTGTTETETIPEALWTAQNAVIDAEIKYLQQLQKDFKERKQETEQHKGQLLEFFEDIIAVAIGKAAAGAVVGTVPALAPVAGFLTQFGVGMLFDELSLWLTEGNAMFDGLIAEDEAIKDLEQSLGNYEHRQNILTRHTQQISAILDQVSQAENGLRQGTTVNGGDLTEYFKEAFLDENEKGFLKQKLEDLTYNDEILELPGGIRIHLVSKIIEYP